jgi:branched-chain amino acid aminotransferase
MNSQLLQSSLSLGSNEIRDCSVSVPPGGDLDPRNLEFGRIFCRNMFLADYGDGKWRDPRIEPLRDFSVHPGSVFVHYAQTIFEGLKAFRHADGRLALFRPAENARRLNISAEIMGMPSFEPEMFVQACVRLTSVEGQYVPSDPGCLYLRPAMIGTEPCLGIRSSATFVFFVLALPTGSYFKETASGAGSISVLVSESSVRAAPGGTGMAKTGGNYAATLRTQMRAKEMGCAQALYLHAVDRRGIEEMGGMNIFFVRDGRLVTPPLSDTILQGIMRNTILTVASDLNIPAQEMRLDINDVLRDIRNGTISEAIASGTAAVLTGINSFMLENGERIPVGTSSPGPITSTIYEHIRGVQYGSQPDPHEWMVYV